MSETLVDTKANTGTNSTTVVADNAVINQGAVQDERAEIKTTEGLGLSEDLNAFLSNSDFRINWQARNQFIMNTLICIGILFSCIVFSVLYYMLFRAGALDASISKMLNTLLWMISGAFMTIVGAYFFGKHFDVSSFRKTSANLIQGGITTLTQKETKP
jgi:hypothetical protein